MIGACEMILSYFDVDTHLQEEHEANPCDYEHRHRQMCPIPIGVTCFDIPPSQCVQASDRRKVKMGIALPVRVELPAAPIDVIERD